VSIEICKWYNNADSPVIFMIDDLANVWVDTNGNGEIDIEEDWGYAKDGVNSSFRFLKEVILKDYPDVKVTFFTPVGVRVGMIENSPIKSISKMINYDEETKQFFKSVNDNPKYEIAYHGTTHGKTGSTVYDFKQEWELFNSVDEAVETISKGIEVYKEVFGYYPKGGKYSGYKTNEFSDKSIDMTGFLWWCRFWNKGLIQDKNCIIGGEDLNPLTNLDIKTFGENKVIDIPSTLNGGLFTGIFNTNIKTIKGIAKVILRKYLINKKLKEIQYLLQNKLVISIQEHISPISDMPPESEGWGRQSPNIFDDEKSLKFIFNYIKYKNVWYCTGSELSEYVYLRDAVNLIEKDEKVFYFDFDKVIKETEITLKIFDNNRTLLKLPSGSYVKINNGIVNVPVMVGEYELF